MSRIFIRGVLHYTRSILQYTNLFQKSLISGLRNYYPMFFVPIADKSIVLHISLLRMYKVLSLLLILCSTIGCNIRGIAVEGNGTISNTVRSLGSFHEVELDGSYDVELSQDATSSISIDADSNLLPLITTEIKGGKLTVSSDKNVNPSHRIKVIIHSPAYTSVDVEGAADVHSATPITSDQLSIALEGSGSYVMETHVKSLTSEISGSGKITLTGEASSHKCTISGSGDLLAAALPTATTNIEINGSGAAEVFVSDRLDADISGAGDVRYKGRVTEVHSNVSGSGRVERMGN